jgi:acyl carrier protein
MSKPAAINTNEIISTVNRVVVEEFETEPEMLVAESRLREDLGLDSLDAVDLVVALELAFGYRIPEQDVKDIRTLGDIYDRIRAHAAG